MCGNKFETIGTLKLHVGNAHTKDNETQTEDIENKSKLVQTFSSEFCCEIGIQTCLVKYDRMKNSYFKTDENIESLQKAMTEFEKYSCFYCSFKITSKCQLKEHIVKCHGSYRSSFLPASRSVLRSKSSFTKPEHPVKFKSRPPSYSPDTSLALNSFPVGFPQPKYTQTFPYPTHSLSTLLPKCEQCGWLASCGTELVNHKKRMHDDHGDPFEVYKQY